MFSAVRTKDGKPVTICVPKDDVTEETYDDWRTDTLRNLITSLREGA